MSETQLLERAPTAKRKRITLVDADLHPVPKSFDELRSYLSPEWRTYLERHGSRRLFAAWGPHVSWAAGQSADVRPEGSPELTPLELLRLQVLDKYSTDFGILNLPMNMYDRAIAELAAEGARAANDWLADRWLAPESRLLGSMIVAWDQPDLAVREIERRAGEGWWAQVLMPSEALEPLGSRKYWPIYEAATAHALPLASHIGNFDLHHGTGFPTFWFEQHLGLAHATRRQLLNIVCEGVFDAVPGTRIVLIEGGISWAVSLRWSLDSAFELLGDEVRLRAKPSEYLDEFVWFTTQPVEEPEDPMHVARLIEHGRLVNRLLFSTDYPHWDWDTPTQALPYTLSNESRARIFAGNASDLYGLEAKSA